jgi:hypothetical protein
MKVAWNNFSAILSWRLAELTDVPTKSKKGMIRVRECVRGIAGKLFDEKWSILDPECQNGKRDIMSILGEHLSLQHHWGDHPRSVMIQWGQIQPRTNGPSLQGKKSSMKWGKFGASHSILCLLITTFPSAIILAGHGELLLNKLFIKLPWTNSDSTSNTLSWALWELAKNHDIQNKLRKEILKYCQMYPGGMIPVKEYDSMGYTVAFIKVFPSETLQE